MRTRPLLAAALVFGALALPAGASGVTTVGSPLTETAFNTFCTCTLTPTAIPGGIVAAPADGVIVRWRVKAGGGQMRLRVLRPTTGGAYDFVSSSDQVTVASTAIQTFPTRLPIDAGDRIGIDVPSTGQVGTSNLPAATTSIFFGAPPADGTTQVPGIADSSSSGVLINADVEADSDRDGFGDETQDACPGDPSRQGACQADLAVRGFADPDPVKAGATLSYTLHVRNLGSSPATAGALNFVLPRGQTLISAKPATGSCSGKPAVSCSLGGLAFGQDVAVVVKVRATRDGRLTMRPTASSSTTDPAHANDLARVTATVLAGRPAISRSGRVSSSGVASVRVSCPRRGPGCFGTLTLSGSGAARKLGSGAYAIRAGRSKAVRVRLGAAGRRIARGRGSTVNALAKSQGGTVKVRGRVRLG